MTNGQPLSAAAPARRFDRAGRRPRCSTCGQLPANPMARAEVATTWLLPDTTASPSVAEKHYCRGCVPPGPVDEVICVRCGDGPLLGGDLAVGDREAMAVVQEWLTSAGWRLSGPVCPGCVGELAR